MRELLQKMSRSFWIFLLLILFMIPGGCMTTGPDQAAENSKKESADMNVSAFSFGEADASLDAEETEDTGEEESRDLTVQFLDVGQGSAALIRQGDSWMLVDGGDREYSSYVVSYLKKQGVTALDYVVISHYDSDHLSGIVGVLNVFECSQILAPDYETDTAIYEAYRKVTEEKGIPVESPALGDTYTFADSSFRIVAPAAYQYEDANSDSLGIRLEYGENSFLICGDCTQESEQDLLYLGVDLKSDVYAANHHGSRYSNSEEFLEAVSPMSVVISCGMGNSYGHPHAPVMLAIQKLGAQLYRTDLQGTITAVSDGSTIHFENEICMDYRSGSQVSGSQETESQNTDAQETESEAVLDMAEEVKYVLNTNSMKFHLPDCSSISDIKESNKQYSSDSREELMEQGYSPCKRCDP